MSLFFSLLKPRVKLKSLHCDICRSNLKAAMKELNLKPFPEDNLPNPFYCFYCDYYAKYPGAPNPSEV